MASPTVIKGDGRTSRNAANVQSTLARLHTATTTKMPMLTSSLQWSGNGSAKQYCTGKSYCPTFQSEAYLRATDVVHIADE